jgi:hypothetical protein
MADRKPSDDKAAFGVYPQMRGKRSRQDPEAAKNVPVDLARGFVAGTLGMPGDVESLVRLPYEMITGNESPTFLPTSEDIEKRLPFRSDTPVSRAASGLGILGGGFYTGPGSAARAITAVPKAVKRAGLDFAESISPVRVVKNKGGNWLGGSIENALEDLKRPDRMTGGRRDPSESLAEMRTRYTPEAIAEMPPELRGTVIAGIQDLEKKVALNNWVDSNLYGYIKNDMATPKDPVRLMLEKRVAEIDQKFAKDMDRAGRIEQRAAAEDDPRRKANFERQAQTAKAEAQAEKDTAMKYASHMPQNEIDYANQWIPEDLALSRMNAGFPTEGLGQSNIAKGWEAITDSYINTAPASEYAKPLTESEARRGLKSVVDDNPWLSKLDPDTPVQYLKNADSISQDLRLDHILDVLREDVASGRIRPDQLSKVSMDQAVRRTAEYDQELAAKMSAARAAQREGLPVYKDYPEGYRWVELNKPGVFASESEAMGHSVRGYEPPKGHPDWVEGSGDRGSLSYGQGGWEGIKSGKAKVYSLVDPKGEPHVTVEVGRPELKFGMTAGDIDPYRERLRQQFPDLNDEKIYYMAVDEFTKDQTASLPPRITQIKGKRNEAPNPEYLPYVQDLVKSGQWSDVGDIRNAGMLDITKSGIRWPEGTQAEQIDRLVGGMEGGTSTPLYKSSFDLTNKAEQELGSKYVTEKEYKDWLSKQINPDVPPPEGMKRGGVVVSNNPDTMMLEVNNKRMQAGGLAKLLRAAPKSKAEIEAIAERMTPQMLGEFVRGDKGTQSVAGKTQKQFAKEKDMTADVRPTKGKGKAPKAVSIEELKDQVMIGIPGDPTIANKTLYGINDMRLDSPSPQHGGPLYGLENDADAFWASGLGAANRVQNLAREAGQQYDMPVLGNYVMMGPESINYAQHFADANLSAINPAKMSKGQIEAFNNMVREGFPYVKNKERLQRVFPAFPGIENPSEAYLHFAIDPELRKHFNALMQMPTVTEKFNLPSGTDVRFAITEPDLRNLETGVTGKSIGRMRPEVEDLGLSSHPTYSHDIPGEFMGSSNYPMPYELSFPDTVKAIRENPKQAPHEFGSLKMVGPRQVIDQQMIDEIRMYEERMKALTGKKKGGAVTVKPEVKKAGGGAIDYNTTPDMSDGGRIMESEPFKQGGKVKMTANRDAMFLELSNKKLKRK